MPTVGYTYTVLGEFRTLIIYLRHKHHATAHCMMLEYLLLLPYRHQKEILFQSFHCVPARGA